MRRQLRLCPLAVLRIKFASASPFPSWLTFCLHSANYNVGMSCRVSARNVFTCAFKRVSGVMIPIVVGTLLGAAHSQATYTSPLPTGVRLDPIGDAIDLGSVPLGMALSPDGNYVAAVLSGWREQGLQIVDLKSRKV